MTPPCRDVGLAGDSNNSEVKAHGQEGTPGSSAKLQEVSDDGKWVDGIPRVPLGMSWCAYTVQYTPFYACRCAVC